MLIEHLLETDNMCIAREHVEKWNMWKSEINDSFVLQTTFYLISHPYKQKTNHTVHTGAAAKYQVSCKLNKQNRYIGSAAGTFNMTCSKWNYLSFNHAPHPSSSISINGTIFHSSQPFQSSHFPICSRFNWSPTLVISKAAFSLKSSPSSSFTLSLLKFRSLSWFLWTISTAQHDLSSSFSPSPRSPCILPPGNLLHFFSLFPIKSKFLGKAWKALHNISQFNAQVLGDHLGLSTISQIHHAYSCFVLAQSDTGSEIGFLNFPTQQTSTHPLKLYSGRCDRFIFLCRQSICFIFSLVIAFIMVNHCLLIRLSSSPSSGLCKGRDNIYLFLFL